MLTCCCRCCGSSRAFSAGRVFDRLLGGVADFLQKRASDDLARFQTGVAADTQIALAQVNAQIEARKLQAQLMQADRGWWVTSWIRPLIVYPCVIHFGAIVLELHVSSRLEHRQAAAAL